MELGGAEIMSEQVSGAVGRVFILRPDRVAAGFRRLRASMPGALTRPNVLDDVVESFLREVGYALEGKLGSPWSRTHGMLRLSTARGSEALAEEFSLLHRCVRDALDALDAEEAERRIALDAVNEASDAAVELLESISGDGHSPHVPFGGLVVEVVEHLPPPAPAGQTPWRTREDLHPLQ